MKTIFPIAEAKVVKFSPKKLQGKYCLDPFMSVAIDPDGNVGLCSCGWWHPTQIGNIKTHTIQQLLQSDLAHRIRQSVRDGSYDYCDDTRCGIIINDRLSTIDVIDDQDCLDSRASTRQRVLDPRLVEEPRFFYLSGDLTCNLSCPSCRTKVVTETDEEAAGRSHVIDLLNSQVFNGTDPRPITIYLSNSGEIFASPRLLTFMENFALDRYPKAEFNLQSNGLLFQKRWPRISHLSENIFNVAITADSHLPDVYAKLRRGGRLSDLEKNLRFIADLKKTLGFHFSLRMVVQKDNADHIESFFDWAQNFQVDDVEYMRLMDWRTYTPAHFKSIDVLDPDHALYGSTMESLSRLKKQHANRVVSWHFAIL